MAKAKKKFDTNPLDPDFPEQVRVEVDEGKTTALPFSNGETSKFADPSDTEEQTRKFNEAEFGAFGSDFGQNQKQSYRPVPVYTPNTDTKRSLNIGSISLPENVLTALPYIPFSIIGVVAAVIELIFIPKTEPKVRYHAAQGLAAQIGIWVVLAGLGVLSFGSDLVDVAGTVFSVVTTIMLIVFAVKAFQGKPIHIAAVQDLTDWLEERISPQK